MAVFNEPTNEWPDINMVNSVLEANDAGGEESFFRKWGEQESSLIHLASYAGKLEVLNRADPLQLDLYVLDRVNRCALHYAAHQGHVRVVEWLIERSPDRSLLSCEDSFGMTALHVAVLEKHVRIVELLVNANVDVNIRDKGKMTPLHLAWLNVNSNEPEMVLRYEEIVDILVSSPRFIKLNNDPIDDSRPWSTILSCAVSLNSPVATKNLIEKGLFVNSFLAHGGKTPLHIAAEQGFDQTLCVLLDHPEATSWMITARDWSQQTPLHVAVREKKLKCAQILVNKGASLSLDGDGLTVLDLLFYHNEHPETFLRELLDEGVHWTDGSPETLTLNFKILAPKNERQMAVISALLTAAPNIEQMSIIQHPLVEVYLGLKWRRLRSSFGILVFLQAIVVASLATFGVLLVHKQNDKVDDKEYDNLPITRILLLCCSIVVLCHSIMQLITTPKYYSRQFETWLAFSYATLCIIVTVAGELGYTHQPGSRKPLVWVLHSISVAIILACIQMMLLIGRCPPWGYYALMFSTVLKNVSKVLLSVIWIIFGFSLSFSILFYDVDHFDNPAKAFLKTVLMMMGEFDYGNIYEERNALNTTSSTTVNDAMITSIISRVIFLVFVMLASIVLMNLMTGLAVVDVQGLLNESVILRLKKQAEFVDQLEQLTILTIFRRCDWVRPLRQMLKARNKIPPKIQVHSDYMGQMPAPGISKELVPRLVEIANKNKHRLTKVKTSPGHLDNNYTITEAISCLQEVLEKLQREQQRIEGMKSSRSNVSTDKV